MITAGNIEAFMSIFQVGDAYKNHCNVGPDAFDSHEATIRSYNEQKGFEEYVNQIADQQCDARVLEIEEETIRAISLMMDAVTQLDNIESKIYTDAYTFCPADNPLDTAAFCSNDE